MVVASCRAHVCLSRMIAKPWNSPDMEATLSRLMGSVRMHLCRWRSKLPTLGCTVSTIQVIFSLWCSTSGAGRTECTYEPAMTKAFLHGRTEAIRTVQPASVNFTRVCLKQLVSYSDVDCCDTPRHSFPRLRPRKRSRRFGMPVPHMSRLPRNAAKVLDKTGTLSYLPSIFKVDTSFQAFVCSILFDPTRDELDTLFTSLRVGLNQERPS